MKWRKLLDDSLPPAAEREYGERYKFGRPASEKQLATAERTLGVRLPDDVREMLSEFNGVWYTTTAGRAHGHAPNIQFLDTKYLSVNVPNHLADYEPSPPRYALRRVVFVAQSNGFGDLWGVCASDVGRHKAGTVVRLGHEVGQLEACQPSLAAFIRGGLFGVDTEFVKRLAKQGRPPSNLAALRARGRQPSFAHWKGTISPELIVQCEDAVTRLAARLVALGPNPTKRQVRGAINGGIKRFDELQWIKGDPWIGLPEQKDICDALHELIDLTGFEASEEWTEIRDW
ncbi:SMI1/KNR4 family protein [Limnoglobus roseus]|uniref:Knr4/Smi1-like domain-containing protein n=1 Tax=Limnoglobus roseus TaxID=2598579 RepID=A0A5C1A9Q7_9BACT|nr:SMI1/KNR4 family protein [Limnoglobus roseus]QEL14923.1 hypothetical protein PX52LOC_01824 [Limnoglobus roseus]